MALPKLNDAPKYELKIPSTQQVVLYRPYLVKEEKILMMAFETQDEKQALRAMLDTVTACVEGDINPNELTTFDIEYMFIQIRGKSVGETSNIVMKCKSCESENEVKVNLTDIDVHSPTDTNIFELTSNISVEMKYPSFNTFIELYDGEKSETQFGFEMLEKCVDAIITEDERIIATDVPSSQVSEFIDSMTSQQLSMLVEYLGKAPTLNHDVEFECSSCQNKNNVNLQGVADFF